MLSESSVTLGNVRFRNALGTNWRMGSGLGSQHSDCRVELNALPWVHAEKKPATRR
jgi:hypothetical protein